MWCWLLLLLLHVLLLWLYLHFSSLICRGNGLNWKILFHVACPMWAAARLTCRLCHPCCRCTCCCCCCCCACQQLSSVLAAGQVVDCLGVSPPSHSPFLSRSPSLVCRRIVKRGKFWFCIKSICLICCSRCRRCCCCCCCRIDCRYWCRNWMKVCFVFTAKCWPNWWLDCSTSEAIAVGANYAACIIQRIRKVNMQQATFYSNNIGKISCKEKHFTSVISSTKVTINQQIKSVIHRIYDQYIWRSFAN